MKHARRDKNQAIKPIENAAMPGNEFCRVFQAEIALDGGKHQIAELPHDADDDAKAQQTDRRIERCVEPDKMRAERKQWRSQRDCAERAADCFVRTGVRNKFSMTK